MNIKEAVEKRIIELCNERNMAINALANTSGVAAVYDLQHVEREKQKSRSCIY